MGRLFKVLQRVEGVSIESSQLLEIFEDTFGVGIGFVGVDGEANGRSASVKSGPKYLAGAFGVGVGIGTHELEFEAVVSMAMDGGYYLCL